MPSRKLEYLELSLYCFAVAVGVVGFLVADESAREAGLFLGSAVLLMGAGLAVSHAAKKAKAAWQEANAKPLWVKVHDSPLLSVFYCQECGHGRAWWHCCRHELNLCYTCLLVHDAPPECYYIPAHRMNPIADLRLQLAMGKGIEGEI